jgi:hypothetical protein
VIIRNYLNQREIYLQNALKFHQLGRTRKSSELFWGAVTQTIKALAATSNFRIQSHAGFKKFVSEVAHETNDQSLLSTFFLMENLHRNFYDESIDQQDFDTYVDLSMDYIKKLDNLIKQKNRHNI